MKKIEVVLISLYVLFCIVFTVLPFILPANSFFNGLGTGSNVLVNIYRDVPIHIYSPLNTTYNFSAGEHYFLELNVSSESPVIDTWWYRLEDLRHGRVVYENITFTPNITFEAVRWSNRLTVFANDTGGLMGNASVIFFIYVPNSAPIIDNISRELYACENTIFVYGFGVTDVDEDAITFDIGPKDPFFVFPFYYEGGQNLSSSSIISVYLLKKYVGVHPVVLSASDGQYADSKSINITVIEINSPPWIYTNLGVYTVWSRGEQSNFYVEVEAIDLEDGNYTSGNLTYSLIFHNESQFFNISEHGGIINWTANSTYVGVHNLSVCVADQGLSNLHPNSSICGETGAIKTTCKDFSLTVTDENRPPYFTYYIPFLRNFTIEVNQSVHFEVGVADPDGTIPDIYWYLDNEKNASRYTSGNSSDSLDITFLCEGGGSHVVTVVATDGLLNASINWTIKVDTSLCPAEIIPSGGGKGAGAGGGKGCEEKWVCWDWAVCQHLETSFLVGNITIKDYGAISAFCNILNLTKDICGYQLRQCIDISNCSSNNTKPDEMQACYYSEHPTCFDGIRNCHDGRCEVLTDCGGPCLLCPTCSDSTRNQGEEGIDCGGPCPFKCGPEEISKKKIKINYGLLLLTILILIVVLIIIIKAIQIIKTRRETKNLAWYKLR